MNLPLVAIVVLAMTAVSSGCPQNYLQLSVGKCYKIIQEDVTWYGANHLCAIEEGSTGYLGIVDTPDELETLRTDFQSGSIATRYWLAGNDITEDDRWKWAPRDIDIDAEYLAYGWAPGPNRRKNEPNNLRNRERCINILGLHRRNFYMNDAMCDKLFRPVCMVADVLP